MMTNSFAVVPLRYTVPFATRNDREALVPDNSINNFLTCLYTCILGDKDLVERTNLSKSSSSSDNNVLDASKSELYEPEILVL